MNARHALENLVAAVRALASCRARPFLVDGTLLGAVREGGFIAHDRDVDLGVFIEELRLPDMIRAMKREGFTHRRTFGSPALGLELAFRRAGIKVDVFFYYLDDAGRFHAAWPAGGRPLRYSYWPFGLAPLAFLGHTFSAPDDTERFLAAKYGPEWRTPVVEWDWKWGPRNAGAWPTEVQHA